VEITERRSAEQKLRVSERRMADIINFLPDATFVIDTTGNVLAWNRAMEKMTGIPAEEMVGRGDYEYALPFYHERRPILVDLVLYNDQTVVARYQVIKKKVIPFSEIYTPYLNNGKGAHLWFTASPLYDAAGNIAGAIESIRDITAIKCTSEALAQSEKEYRLIIEHMQDAFIRTNMEGTILMVNPSFLTEFGYENEKEVLGKDVRELMYINPMERDIYLHELARSGTVRGYPLTWRRKDGNIVEILVSSHINYSPMGVPCSVEGDHPQYNRTEESP